jgi:thiamine biosynthesis lipoprotein
MRTSIRSFAPAFAIVLGLLAGCSAKPHSRYWTAMDCNFDATIHGDAGKVAQEDALDSLQALAARYERLFSDYDPSGPLSVLRGRKGDTVDVDPEIVTVLRKALETDRHSGNSFDMGVHDLKRFWGIGGGLERVPPRDSIDLFLKKRFGFVPTATDTLPDPIAILPDNRVILLIDSLPIDLGGIAKGYTVDKMSEKLAELGYPNHLIQGGGEIRTAGRKRKGQWGIGIKNPRNTDTIVGVIGLDSGRAVSTSGDYERFFIHEGVRYHHIFDARTGSPARGGTISVTLLCPSSFTCDAWSKPMFVLGPRRGRKLADSLGIQAFWVRETPGGLCSRRTDLWGAKLDATVVPTCPSDW